MHKHANVNTRKITRLTAPSDFLRLASRSHSLSGSFNELDGSFHQPQQARAVPTRAFGRRPCSCEAVATPCGRPVLEALLVIHAC